MRRASTQRRRSSRIGALAQAWLHVSMRCCGRDEDAGQRWRLPSRRLLWLIPRAIDILYAMLRNTTAAVGAAERRSAAVAPPRAWRCLLRACRRSAQALEHEGKGGATGKEGVGDPRERAMPKPHRRQATWAPRVSVPPSVAPTRPPTAQIGRAWRCLLKALTMHAQVIPRFCAFLHPSTRRGGELLLFATSHDSQELQYVRTELLPRER